MPDVTWWGHSTCTIDDRGVRVLTDPLFCSRLGHLRRRRGPLPDDRSRRADLAVVSHLHADHLHLGSLSVLPRHVPVAVPGGALRAVPGLRRLRDRELVEVVPGDTVRVGDVVVEVVPAEHDGHRWPWSRRRAPALGYVVSGKARTYFAGDTDWSPVVREAVGRCDIALLPVGGWGPTLGLRAPRRGARRRLPGRARRPPRRSGALRHDVAGRPRTGPPGPVQPPRNGVRRARRPVASPLRGAGAAARGDGAARCARSRAAVTTDSARR